MAYYIKAPGPGGPRASSPGSETETVKKPKFDKDFIVLSEFSEQVGPIPLETYPDDKAKGHFDTNQFSVRIMSSDFQSSSGKLVGEDSQVLLSEKQDCAYAYVHYFSLNDIHARGFIRQLCLSYISSSPRKLLDNFEEMKRQFCEVTTMLRCCNLKVFKRDLTQHLADLEHTMDELKKEGLTEGDEIDAALLYHDYDFSKEDVPERDPEQVRKSMNDTCVLLDAVKVRMSEGRHHETWGEIKKLRRYYKEQKILKEHQKSRAYLNESPITRKSAFTSYLAQGNVVESPDSGADLCESYSSELTNSTSSGDLSHYEPRRVMTHIVQRFERRLRQLSELAPKAYKVVNEKIKQIYRYFHRSELVLEMEKDEREFLDPRSSILTIGRIPIMNVLQDYSRHLACQQPPIVHAEKDYQLSCRNTRALPCTEGEFRILGEGDKSSSDFDTTFLDEKSNLNRLPLYIDPLPRSTHFGAPTDSFAYSENFDETDLDQTASLSTPLVEYSSCSLAGNSGGGDTTDSMNMDISSLTVPHDDDKVSHGSRPSTAFATPKTGMTPTSSDHDEGSEATSRDSTLNRHVKSSDLHSHELSPEQVFSEAEGKFSEVERESSEPDRESSSPTSVSTPSFDRLQLPVLDKPLEKSDDFSCTSTLTGSQGSLLLNDNGSRTNSHNHHHHQQQPALPNPENRLGISFYSKTKTASPRMTKHEATFNSVNGAVGMAKGQRASTGLTSLANISINNGDGDRDERATRDAKSESLEVWTGNQVIDSAAISSRSTSCAVSSSVSTSAEYPPHLRQVPSMMNENRTDRYTNAASANGEVEDEEEEKHSAGSGSFSNTHLENSNSSNVCTDPPPYSISNHTIFDAHRLPPYSPPTSQSTATMSNKRMVDIGAISGTSQTNYSPPSGTGNRSAGGGGSYHRHSNPRTSNGRLVPTGTKSNGGIPSRKEGMSSRKFSLPKRLSLEDHEGISPERFYSPMSLPANTFSLPSQATAVLSTSTGTAVHVPPRQHPLSPGLVSINSMSSLVSNMTAASRCSYRGPSVVEIRGKGKLPLISSVDQVEGPYKFKPGKGIIPFCRDHPNFSHLIYCLLHGRPLIIVGKSSDKDMIRRLIRVLWLFVPGHSSRNQVIPWQEKQLDIRDLSRVKLVGLCSQGQNSIGAHLKNYVSWWDCTAGKLYTPQYDGELLKPITTRNRDRKTEEVFLTYIHSVLADIAMKAYIYYHSFCANLPQLQRQPSASEASPQKYHKVAKKEKTRAQFLQKIGVKGCDMDIIENLVEVLREQQLTEWNRDFTPVIGTFQDDYPQPVTVKLHTRLCTEAYCKPKRPY